MNERRNLLNLIDQDDIPSSATAWDGSTSLSAQGNVFYIPLFWDNDSGTVMGTDKKLWFPCIQSGVNTYRSLEFTNTSIKYYVNIGGYKCGPYQSSDTPSGSYSTIIYSCRFGLTSNPNNNSEYFYIANPLSGGYMKWNNRFVNFIVRTNTTTGVSAGSYFTLDNSPDAYVKITTQNNAKSRLRLSNSNNGARSGSEAITGTPGWKYPIYIDTE